MKGREVREEKEVDEGITQEQGEEVHTHVIACAMTESCEWRGQIWICLRATGTNVCRVVWVFCTAGAFQFVRSGLVALLIWVPADGDK